VQRDKERLAKKLDAPKETFVMPEVAKYDSFHKPLFCITLPNFVKIGQTVGEIWRFNGLGCLPS